MKRLLGVALLGAFTAGCGQYGYGYYRRGPSVGGQRSYYWVAIPAGRHSPFSYYSGASTTPAADDDQRAVEEAEGSNVDTWLPEKHPRPPRNTEIPEPRVPFDPGAALASLHAIDLAPCAARGAPAGYGHARVTFAEDGSATQVLVDAPTGMEKEAVACVGDRLATATAPGFDGAPITVGTSYLVK